MRLQVGFPQCRSGILTLGLIFILNCGSASAQLNPEPPPPSGSTLALTIDIRDAPLYTTVTQTTSMKGTTYSFATPSTLPHGPYPITQTADGKTTKTIPSSSWVANDDGFAGLSYEKSILQTRLLDRSDAAMVSLFGILYSPNSGGVLRIGGNSVNENVWTPNGSGRTAGQIAPADVDAFASFVKKVGWKVIYGLDQVNVGSNSTASTERLAGEEAIYVQRALGANLLAFEIGNEPSNYIWEGYEPSGWGVRDYVSLYEGFASTIENALSSNGLVPVRLAGPASDGVSRYDLSWFWGFASARLSNVVNLTHHYYIGSASQHPSPTVLNLIAYPDRQLESVIEELEFYGFTTNTHWRMGETNSYYGGGTNGLSNSYASTLWVIDDLFTLARFGSLGGSFHGGNTTPYSPITNRGSTVLGPRPIFYGLYFSTLVGTGDLQQVEVSGNASNANVSVYAVQPSAHNADLNIVINNKSPRTLSITLTPEQTIKRGTLRILTNSSMPDVTTLTSSEETTVLSKTSGATVQGCVIGNDGSFVPNAPYTLTASGNTVRFTVPPLSAALASLTDLR